MFAQIEAIPQPETATEDINTGYFDFYQEGNLRLGFYHSPESLERLSLDRPTMAHGCMMAIDACESTMPA